MQRFRSRGGPGGTGRSVLVSTLYLACTLLVFSFILFEVLDVDASDFPTPAKSSVKLVEPPHDLKRSLTHPTDANLEMPAASGDAEGLPAQVALLADLARPPARASRLTLPRASLPDPAPSR